MTMQLLELARAIQADRERSIRQRHSAQVYQPSGRRHPAAPEHGVDEGPVAVTAPAASRIRTRPAVG